MAELAKLAEVPETTVRHYVVQHLLRPIEFRGTKTRYSRRDLLTLLGLLRLKSEGKATLQERKARLDALSDAELEQLISSGPVSPAAAAALGIQVATPSLTPPTTTSATPGIGSGTVELWQRIALLPGLDLMLRADANDAARNGMQRICAEFLVR